MSDEQQTQVNVADMSVEQRNGHYSRLCMQAGDSLYKVFSFAKNAWAILNAMANFDAAVTANPVPVKLTDADRPRSVETEVVEHHAV